jgi:hypothetical protein
MFGLLASSLVVQALLTLCQRGRLLRCYLTGRVSRA